MSELQATVEFSVELHKFHNVDLFQRGFYQIRTSLKVSPKISVKIEVNLAKSQKAEKFYFPPYVANGCGISRTFQILYRNEEVLLENVILFRVHLLVDSHKIEETLQRADFTINVELWFSEQSFGLTVQGGTTCVSTRTLHLHFSPIKGLHYHLPVLFDYFHLAAVTITIHAILVALHQPYIKKSILHYVQSCTPRSAKPLFGTSHRLQSRHPHSAIDTLFFGNVNSTKCVSSGSRLAHARHIHQEVCSILLTTYDTLQAHLQEYMKLLPSWQQLKFETNDCLKRLNNLSDTAKLIEAEDDFISLANSNIAQLCAENILLWQQFLEAFTCKDAILQHLAKNHHQLRVKRFSEAFFVVDNPRQSAAGCYDANYQNYMAVSETVRRSRYLASLPRLPVTCAELDGDIATMPIIFEDLYQDVAEFARRRKDASRKLGNIADPFLNSVNDNMPQHSMKAENCNCGVAAILESRSQRNSSHVRSNSTSQQNIDSIKSNGQVSIGVLKVENKNEIDNVVKATLTIGSSKSNGELIANISTLLLKYKEQENGKILTLEQCKALSSRQRHSKSLDQLKNTGVYTNQVPTTSPNPITRSTSSQMHSNIPNSISKFAINDSLKVEVNSLNGSNGAGSSSNTDSEEYTSRFKKLEQSLSAPYNLCEYPVLNNSDFCLSKKMKHSESTLSMPNANEISNENYKDSVKFLVGNNSESMPNLTPSPNGSPQFGLFLSRPSYKKLNDNRDGLALYEINDSTIIEEICDDHCFISERKSPKRELSLSSPLSSMSDEMASDQSGRASSESHCSSRGRSPLVTSFGRPELPDYSTLQLQKIDRFIPEPIFDGEMLIEKLEKLAVSSEKTHEMNDAMYEDVRLPPPQQFRDVPSPPEHFRDPPLPKAHKWQMHRDSVDNLLYHFCEQSKEAKKLEEISKGISNSIENFTFENVKEGKRPDRSPDRSCSKKSRKNLREEEEEEEEEAAAAKVATDEDFDEFNGQFNGSDSDNFDPFNLDEVSRNEKPNKSNISSKSQFLGYLFKEDIEALKKTYEMERKKNLMAIRTLSNTQDSFSERFSGFSGSGTSSQDSKAIKDGDKSDWNGYDKAEKSKYRSWEEEVAAFVKAKEEFKRQMNFTGMLYSDFPTLASTLPYFHISDEYRIFSPEGLHLIICVHGLDGNSNDLRMVKTYVELGLPGANLEFIMSERNQGDTFSDFETMTDKLVSEIIFHVDAGGLTPSKVSFIGHSLGNIIIRSAITRPQLQHLVPRFHTFLSLSGPHLGTLYNNSGLVNMGMWFMQKWKKSGSLLQLSLKDAPDIRQSFLYRLSQKSNLHHFKHILLCGSSQDRYVPMHSARIELCKAAVKDNTIQGAVYREMVHNIMHPVINSTNTTLVRYDIHHALPNTANSIIGRAAHIAVLDSEVFIEKFLVVTGLKYFR